MIVAFCADAEGSGKTTAAQYLMQTQGFRGLKFADGLKNMTMSFLYSFGIDPDMVDRYVNGDLKEIVIPEVGVTSRHLQRTLGTEWGRKHIGDDIWVRLMSHKVDAWTKAGCFIVIDDLRFLNEYELLKDNGALIIRVTRPGLTSNAQGHASEGALSGIEMPEIINDGSVEDLYEKVNRAIGHTSNE